MITGQLICDSLQGKELAVYLPPSYERDGSARPVVYVQDGCALFDPQRNDVLLRLERMFAHGELLELILVGVKPASRLDDYTPWPAKALEEKYADFGGRGSAYASWLTSALKPYIDQAFRTDSRRAATAMIGASLGGLISLYTAYLYADTIGKFGSISGSLWYEGFLAFMQREKIENSDIKLYMYVGSVEGAGKRSIQRHMVANTRRAHAALTASGLSPERLQLVVEEGAGHSPAFFEKRFPAALQWLFAAP